MIQWIARVAAGLVILALVAIVAGGVAVRTADHDPAVWHLRPTAAERTGKPNDFLAAPAGTTVATVDVTLAPTDAAAAMTAFDSAARAASRVAVVAGSVEEGFITYVQRSALIGFPDYISVETVEGGIAIWSRSRYGHSDLGVNEKRVRAWLAEAGLSSG
ncbi:MAG: DUF1499 domain-containing protein [Pseudomonadota bacterium]